jgi:excisionase family DNA binding protein
VPLTYEGLQGLNNPDARPPAITKLLTPEDVAEALNLPVTWVRGKARSGELPALKLGRYWRFAPGAIDDYIAGL